MEKATNSPVRTITFRAFFIIVLLSQTFLPLTQLSEVSANEPAGEALEIEQEEQIEYLENVGERLDTVLDLVQDEISDQEIVEQVEEVKGEIEELIEEKQEAIDDAGSEEEIEEIIDETKKRIVLKTFDSITEHNDIEEFIDVEGGQAEQEEATEAVIDMIDKGSRKTLMLKSQSSFDQSVALLQKFDDTVSATHLFDEDGWTFMDVSFYEDGLVGQEILDTVEDGVIPKKLMDFFVVKPTVLTIDQLSIEGEDIQNLRGQQLWNTPLYQESLQSLPTVTVGVIDTGVDYNHQDLQGAISTAIPGYDFVNDDADAMDDHKHGTHVAGTIAGQINGAGVFGTNTGIDIVPLKICTSSGYCPSYAIINAVAYASQQGIDVINMSLSGQESVINNPICQAIDDASQQGVVAVVAAGNHNINTGQTVPGACPKTITVGAVDTTQTRASFSNRGDLVDVSAPGVGIYSTELDNGYGYLNGTSMATPHVSGIVGAIKAVHPNRGHDQILGLLLENTLTANYEAGKEIGPVVNYEHTMSVLGVTQNAVDASDTTAVQEVTEDETSETVVCDEGFIIQSGVCVATTDLQIPEENKPTDGLVVEYDFDTVGSTVIDESGNGNDADIIGGVTFWEGVAKFDGLHESLELQNYIPTFSNDYTIGMMIKVPLESTKGYKSLVSSKDNNRDRHILVSKDGRVGVYQSRSNTPHMTDFNLNSLGDGWHHLVAVGANGETKFYANGTHVGTAGFKSRKSIGLIGNITRGSTPQPFGEIDNVRIYNRALTDQEITDWIPGNVVQDPAKVITSKEAYSVPAGTTVIANIYGGTGPYHITRDDKSVLGLARNSTADGITIADDSVLANFDQGGEEEEVLDIDLSSTEEFLFDSEEADIQEEYFEFEDEEDIPYEDSIDGTVEVASSSTVTRIRLLGLKPGTTTLSITDSLGKVHEVPVTVSKRTITSYVGEKLWLSYYSKYQVLKWLPGFDSSLFEKQYIGGGRYLVTPLQLGQHDVIMNVYNKQEKRSQYIHMTIDVVEPPFTFDNSSLSIQAGTTQTLTIQGGTPPFTIIDPRNNILDYVSPTIPQTIGTTTTIDLYGLWFGWTKMVIKDATGARRYLPVQVLDNTMHTYHDTVFVLPRNPYDHITIEQIDVDDTYITSAILNESTNMWEITPQPGAEGLSDLVAHIRNSNMSQNRIPDRNKLKFFIGDDSDQETLAYQNAVTLQTSGTLKVSNKNLTIEKGSKQQIVVAAGVAPYAVTSDSTGVAITETFATEGINISATYDRYSFDVTGLEPGEHTITITSSNGKTGIVTVTVPGPQPLTLSQTDVEMNVGDELVVTIEDGNPIYSITRGDDSIVGVKTVLRDSVSIASEGEAGDEYGTPLIQNISSDEDYEREDIAIANEGELSPEEYTGESVELDIGRNEGNIQIANEGDAFSILGFKEGQTQITIVDADGREGVITVTVNPTLIHMKPGVRTYIGGYDEGYWFYGLEFRPEDPYFFGHKGDWDGRAYGIPSRLGETQIGIDVVYYYAPKYASGNAMRHRYATLYFDVFAGTDEQFALYQTGTDLGPGDITFDKEAITLTVGETTTLDIAGGTPQYVIGKSNEGVALGIIGYQWDSIGLSSDEEVTQQPLIDLGEGEEQPIESGTETEQALDEELEVGNIIYDTAGNELFTMTQELKDYFEQEDLENQEDEGVEIATTEEGDLYIMGLQAGTTILTVTDNEGYAKEIEITVLAAETLALNSAVKGQSYSDRIDDDDLYYTMFYRDRFCEFCGARRWGIRSATSQDSNVVGALTLNRRTYFYGLTNGTADIHVEIWNNHERRFQAMIYTVSVNDFTLEERNDLKVFQASEKARFSGEASSIGNGGTVTDGTGGENEEEDNNGTDDTPKNEIYDILISSGKYKE